MSEDTRIRLQQLWERRLAVGAEDPDAHKAELRAFGVTFASGKLDPDWAIENLERAVLLAGAPKLSQWVVEKLAEIATSLPTLATRILASILERPENEWEHIAWRDEARTIVQFAVRSGDPDAADNCRLVVDYYVRHGDLDFRQLLDP